jgi:predicted negative regulator of RcsB-dependent stress response
LFNEAFKQSLTLRDEERDASLEWIVHYSTDVGNHNLARKLVKEIKNSFYKDISYLCISRSLAKNSMISASLEVLDKIESSYFKALAKACIANEVYPSEKSLSESLFASIMRDLDNLDCFNVVCLLSHTLYLREKFMERRLTIQMLNKAMNALKKLKHKQLHDIASARLIPSLLKHSKYAEVEKILSLIQDPFYASLARVRISFVLMSRKKDLAFKFLSSLRMKGIQGSYKEIIRAEKARLMALGGKLEEAVRLAREIEDEGYRGVAIKNIVDALVEKERVMITELLKV